MNTEEYLGALDQYLSERETNRKRADELLKLNRLNQVNYPSMDDPWFVPKMIGKGLYQWLADDTELNGDMGTPGLREGAQFAMMAPLMVIPGALGGGALTRSLTGAGLNVLSGTPFYATDPDNADVLMDAAVGAGMGAGGLPGAIIGGVLGWSPEPETGKMGRKKWTPWTPYEEYPSGRRGQRFAGGGLVRSLGKRAIKYLDEMKDPLTADIIKERGGNWFPGSVEAAIEPLSGRLGEVRPERLEVLREQLGNPEAGISDEITKYQKLYPEAVQQKTKKNQSFAEGGFVTPQQIITQHGGRIEKSEMMTPKEIIAHHGGRYA